MGGGLRSKFKFPVPGRSSKKQEVPTVSVSAPLSKAQRVLGADGINIGSSRLAVGHGRSWETASAGGISVSVSESSASQATRDTGFDREDDDDSPETNYGRSVWEEESAIIPRQIRSAHEPGRKGLTTKPSLITVGNESREHLTNASARGRRLSSSTIDTHYDAAKMPLAISQQTSNSAMAKGLGPKISEVLDMDGIYGGGQVPSKKKPARLDLSRLRHKYRNKNETARHDRHDGRSPSLASQQLEISIPSGSTLESSQRTPRRLMKHNPPAQSPPTLRSPRSRGITDATGLHQLYNHYEQMSFPDEQGDDGEEEEAEQEDLPAPRRRNPTRPRPPSTFTHSLIAPLPFSLPHGPPGTWGHSRNDSHDSKMAASATDSAGGLQVNSVSRKDYDASISSRHTRTSKASPSTRSMVGSDRLQNSVLSLSDSSDDEVMEPIPSAPLPRRASVGIMPDTTYTGKSQRSPNQLRVNTSGAKFTPSLNQLDEHLHVNSAPRSQSSRSPSNNTLRSSQSSMGTVTQAQGASSSSSNIHLASKSTETLDTLESSRQPTTYGVQEARVVSFVPLASTAEAASQVAMSEHSTHIEKFILRQNSNATSRFSRNSDQPTPPLSPASVEFYVKSRESLQRDAMAGGSTEAYNARLMAVTRQEEMLLAALRKKRAKMREVNSEDEKSPTTRSKSGSLKSVKRSNTASSKGGSREPTILEHQSEFASASWQRADSTLLTRHSRDELRRRDQQHGGFHRELLHDIDVPSTASRSDVTEGTATSATESTASTTFDSRNDRVLLYLDRPSGDVKTVDVDADSSDYMDDSDGEDLIVNERRTSRMQSRRDSACNTTTNAHAAGSLGGRRGGNYTTQHRKDSIPISPLTAPIRMNRLQDVPEDEPQSIIPRGRGAGFSVDDSLDAFPEPPVPPPSWPLPPPPGKPPPPPAGPSSPGLLHPSSAMRQLPSPEQKPSYMKNKRSNVRLSAVGHSFSPMPYWGDED